MAWRVYKRPRGTKAVPYPMVTIGKSGIFINRFAMSLLKEVQTVVVMLDKDEAKIGFWFFKNTIDKSVASEVYNINRNNTPTGVIGQINCSRLLRDEDWVKKHLDPKSGRGSFALLRDNEQATMNDFYVVALALAD